MKNKNETPKKVLLAIVLFTGAAFTSRAQVTIFTDNFDSLSGGAPGYSYGAVTNFLSSYVAGVGASGSVGMVLQGDITSTPNYAGLASQYQAANVTGNSSANLSDYTLSFDMEANSAIVNDNGAVQVFFQSFSTPTITGGATGSGYVNETPSAANQFTHYTINLGSLILDNGYTSLPLMNTSGSFQIGWSVATPGFTQPLPGVQLVIDNPTLTMVPEPASVTFCALGGVVAAFAFVRRRRSSQSLNV